MNETSTHRQRMYDVPRWERRAAARNGVVEFGSRDSGRSAVTKKAANAKRRQADRRATQEA